MVGLSLILLQLCSICVYGHYHANLQRFHESILAKEHPVEPSLLKAVETQWFTQSIDHFSPTDQRTFKQRYYVNTEYYKPGGPAFLYIGGESELSAGSIASGAIVENAKVHNALLFALEHRYYGATQPFSDWSTENLLYLSAEQALMDAAKFVDLTSMQYSPNATLQWFNFGGSYPGSLSAWFRLKYPHHTSGSVASSAPVLAKADFFEYDQAVSHAVTSYSTTCAADIRAATKSVEFAMDANPELADSFSCGMLSSGDEFLYVLADAVAYSVQYTTDTPGARYHLLEHMCATMGDAKLDRVERYRSFLDQLLSALSTNCADFTTTLASLSNTTVTTQSQQRQWYYQSCTEFGYFQTAPAVNSLRSTRIDLAFHLQQCHDAFGYPFEPDVPRTNSIYGGNNTHGSRIFFSNGSLDPWRVLSVTEQLPCCDEQPALVIQGTSHCADLSPAHDSDPQSLTQAREVIDQYINKWLQEARV